ncbi:MAG: hypothetical protein R2882_00380 [Gemmatimonadales bacterium]
MSYLTAAAQAFHFRHDEHTSFFPRLSFAGGGDWRRQPGDAISGRVAAGALPGPEPARIPDHVTGRSAHSDLDVRNVSAGTPAGSKPPSAGEALVILILAFGALVAALLPLAIGVLAIAVSLTAVLGLLTSFRRCRCSC